MLEAKFSEERAAHAAKYQKMYEKLYTEVHYYYYCCFAIFCNAIMLLYLVAKLCFKIPELW
jgi:hypothetical protein